LSHFDWRRINIIFIVLLPALCAGCGDDDGYLLSKNAVLAAMDRIEASFQARSIEEILALDENEIDPASASLILSNDFNINISIEDGVKQVNRIAEEILRTMPDKPNPREAIDSINSYFFSHFSILGADITDDPASSLVAKVLADKRGNSLGVSLLYISVGKRLGLPLYLVLTPTHAFVRYQDSTITFNIETMTKGGEWKDSTYCETFKTTNDKKYLRNLSSKETVAVVLSNVAWIWHNLGKVDKALQYCSIALKQFPHLDDAQHCRICALLQKREYDKILSECSRKLKGDTKNSDAYFFRSMVWKEKKEWKKVISDASMAIKLDPMNSLAYYVRGLAFYGEKSFDSAEADYSRAIGIVPEKASYYLARASARYELELFEEAISDCANAIKLNPESDMAYFQRGKAFIKIKENEKALSDLNKAIEINPEFRYAYFERAQFYSRVLNKPNEAKQDFTKFDELKERDDG